MRVPRLRSYATSTDYTMNRGPGGDENPGCSLSKASVVCALASQNPISIRHKKQRKMTHSGSATAVKYEILKAKGHFNWCFKKHHEDTVMRKPSRKKVQPVLPPRRHGATWLQRHLHSFSVFPKAERLPRGQSEAWYSFLSILSFPWDLGQGEARTAGRVALACNLIYSGS